ncbi:MAG: NTP pyrophosphohydrolase [Candidatus Moraniibacteriota bacterium]|nr:MAG: NTP pyrophosphohydrolase [Candidatus Moranbacteria bacterium]
MDGYIKKIREMVGTEHVMFNFAIACIVNSKNEILLQKRGDDGHENLWGLPGGALEINESFADALLRETKEETGLNVTIESLIGIYSDYHATYTNGDKSQTIAAAFLCSPQNETFKIDGKETLKLQYFAKNDIPKLCFVQHDDIVKDWKTGKNGFYR